MTLVVGKAVDSRTGLAKDQLAQAYLPMFYIFAITTGLDMYPTSGVFLVLLYFLIPNDNPKAEIRRKQVEKTDRDTKEASSKWQQFRALMTHPRFIQLLVITMLVGYGRQTMYMLRPIFVEERILGNDPDKKLWTAISALSGLISEFVVLFMGKSLLQRVGTAKLMAISLFAVSLRVWCHYVVPEGEKQWIYFLIVVELLRGIHLASLNIAAVQMSSDIAGPDLQGTAQGIFAGVNNGLSGVSGSFGCGLILKLTGQYKAAFLASSVLTTVVFVIVIARSVLLRCQGARVQ